MTEGQHQIQDEPARFSKVEDEINLLDLLLVLVRNKRLILGVCAATLVLTTVITLLIPNIYTATARILPPQQEKSSLGTLMGGMSDLAVLAGLSVGGGSGDLYVGMLQSRTVADAIIDRFDLMSVYSEKYRVHTYEELKEHAAIALGKKDGIITISVEDKDPQRAAAMANAFVEEIKRLNVRLNLSSAGRERAFLEERLVLVKEDLRRTEETLKKFQEENRAIKIDDQATAMIESISRLRAELASKEVEVGVLLTYQTEQNSQVKALREAISQIKAQLRRLEQAPGGQALAEDRFISTSEVPALGVQYARLLRDFKIQETLFELLTKQFEVAKVSEAKATSTIQVIDEAVVPDRKSKPTRSLIVFLATLAAGCMGILWVFVREYSGKMTEEDRLRWAEVKALARFKNQK